MRPLGSSGGPIVEELRISIGHRCRQHRTPWIRASDSQTSFPLSLTWALKERRDLSLIWTRRLRIFRVLCSLKYVQESMSIQTIYLRRIIPTDSFKSIKKVNLIIELTLKFERAPLLILRSIRSIIESFLDPQKQKILFYSFDIPFIGRRKYFLFSVSFFFSFLFFHFLFC